MTTLSGLIARLEAAKEGSRELDALVGIAINGVGGVKVRHYTTSLDAALTLFDDDGLRQFKLERNSTEYGNGWHVSYRSMFFGHSSKAPLALCIAALKAREARR